VGIGHANIQDAQLEVSHQIAYFRIRLERVNVRIDRLKRSERLQQPSLVMRPIEIGACCGCGEEAK
jgi:hypothetical protein